MEREILIRLVTGAQNGDSAAMDALFTNFYNDVYYFALKTVKDSDIACDITQETFLEIIRTIGSLKEPAAFVTWTKQITYHQCTRYFKKKKEVLVEEEEDGSTIFDTLVDESEDSIPSEVYEKEEFRNTILQLINELTEEQRSAVMLFYFDELTVGQIAQIQNVSEGTVKSRLNYARKGIKKSVESYEKKHDIKLHSFSFLPLFLLFFRKETMPVEKAAEIGALVSNAASTAAAGGAGAAAVGSATVASVGGTATAAGVGIAAKLAAVPLVAKIIAALVAVAIVISGGVVWMGSHGNQEGTIQQTNGGQHQEDAGKVDQNSTENGEIETTEPSEHYDLDGSGAGAGYCDHCGVPMCVLGIPTMHWDRDQNCTCDECGYVEHFHGWDEACGHCDVCYKVLGILDRDGDEICDLCGEKACGKVHPHADEDGDNSCDFCGMDSAEPDFLAAPYIAVDVDNETAVLIISPVAGATGYEIRINGSYKGNKQHEGPVTTFTIFRDMLAEGENTILVCAYREDDYSPDSNAVTVGKLAEPTFHATGTGIEFLWGDVENAQGYIIYGEDGEFLTTIGLGESYDFSSIYTEDGFYFPYIQAYAEGWISSERQGIPVSVGSHGGPIGNP